MNSIHTLRKCHLRARARARVHIYRRWWSISIFIWYYQMDDDALLSTYIHKRREPPI